MIRHTGWCLLGVLCLVLVSMQACAPAALQDLGRAEGRAAMHRLSIGKKELEKAVQSLRRRPDPAGVERLSDVHEFPCESCHDGS